MPSAAAREVITAPPTLASDLLKATVTASTRSSTPGLLGGAAAALAEHPQPVRLVDHQPGAENRSQSPAMSASGAVSPVIE